MFQKTTMSFELFKGIDPKSKSGEEYFFYRADLHSALFALIGFGIDISLVPSRWLDVESAARLGAILLQAIENGKAADFYRHEYEGDFPPQSECDFYVEAMLNITQGFAQFLVESGGCEAVGFLLPKFLDVQGMAMSDQLFKGIYPKSRLGEEYFIYRADFRSQLNALIEDEIDISLIPLEWLDAESSDRLGGLLQLAIENGKAANFYRCDYRRHFVPFQEIDSHVETMIRITKEFSKFLVESGGCEAVD